MKHSGNAGRQVVPVRREQSEEGVEVVEEHLELDGLRTEAIRTELEFKGFDDVLDRNEGVGPNRAA